MGLVDATVPGTVDDQPDTTRPPPTRWRGTARYSRRRHT